MKHAIGFNSFLTREDISRIRFCIERKHQIFSQPFSSPRTPCCSTKRIPAPSTKSRTPPWAHCANSTTSLDTRWLSNIGTTTRGTRSSGPAGRSTTRWSSSRPQISSPSSPSCITRWKGGLVLFHILQIGKLNASDNAFANFRHHAMIVFFSRLIRDENLPLFQELCDEQVLLHIEPEVVKERKKQRKVQLEISDIKQKLSTANGKNIVLSNREIRLLRWEPLRCP